MIHVVRNKSSPRVGFQGWKEVEIFSIDTLLKHVWEIPLKGQNTSTGWGHHRMFFWFINHNKTRMN